MDTVHKIITANANNMSTIADKSVHLIVTSPPYPLIEMWDEAFSLQDRFISSALETGQGEEAFLKMHVLLNEIWKECDRVLIDGGFVCVNIGDATRNIGGLFQMYSNHTQVTKSFIDMKYSVLPDILWRKPSNSPNKFMGSGMYPAGAYVTHEHEYILIFRKGGNRQFSEQEKLMRRKSAYFWEERNIWFSDLWEIKGTQQNITKKTAERKRNASFPIEIPYRLINMYSIEGDTILDPFVGLGTTSIASISAHRNSIGVEIDRSIVELAKENIISSMPIIQELPRQRIIKHNAFINSLSHEKRTACYMNENHRFRVKTKQETQLRLDLPMYFLVNDDCIVCRYAKIL